VTEIIRLAAADVAPERHDVLEGQGIPTGMPVSEQIEELCTIARDMLVETAAPVGVLADISKDDFARVYAGEGRNEHRTPVGEIFGRAEHLGLFAVTLGQRTGEEIDHLFAANDFALASMLDSAASAAAERAADQLERSYVKDLGQKGWFASGRAALRYSPGYCGWHVSGQRKLFDVLKPERIGLTLRDSYLMQPLKSVSGVIIGGPREIHNFPISYDFCNQCETRTCRQRLRAVFANKSRQPNWSD
jgi:hypothetical protein